MIRAFLLAALLATPAMTATGGALRLTASSGIGSMDVQTNYTLKAVQTFAFTYDGLVTFRKAAGEAGAQVVADLADAVPEPTDGGRLYTFHLRPGIRFSDGAPVTTADVVASLRRLFVVRSPNAASWYAVIEGGESCVRAPDSCVLPGVTHEPRSGIVAIRLARPDPEFLEKLALPFASVLPAGTPTHDVGVEPAAGTGPYRCAHYDPQSGARFERNPFFAEWSHEAQPAGGPDEIDYAFGLTDEAEVTAVINGQQDWMFEPVPVDRLGELGARHAGLVHIVHIAAFDYLMLNNRLAPFDNRAARLAVAYAVDRRAVANLFGGQKLAVPHCQLLPAGLSGYEPYCPFTENPGAAWTKPDLARARALMAESGTAGQKVTIVTTDAAVDRSVGLYLQSVLRTLGFDAGVKAISAAIQFSYIQNSNNRVQAATTAWEADYPAPSDFLHVLFSCSNIHPGSDSSINMSGYCDAGTDAAMADALAAPDPAKWAAIDRRITDEAPVVPLFQRTRLDLLSSRVGNWQWSPVYNMLFSQATVQ